MRTEGFHHTSKGLGHACSNFDFKSLTNCNDACFKDLLGMYICSNPLVPFRSKDAYPFAYRSLDQPWLGERPFICNPKCNWDEGKDEPYIMRWIALRLSNCNFHQGKHERETIHCLIPMEHCPIQQRKNRGHNIPLSKFTFPGHGRGIQPSLHAKATLLLHIAKLHEVWSEEWPDCLRS